MLLRGIVHADDVLCTAAEDQLAIAIWQGTPTEYHVLKIHEAVAERVQLYSRALLLVVVARPVLPDEPSRRRMTAVMDSFKDQLMAINVCIEVGGLFGAALRTMGRAITLASRARTPTLFSDSLQQAAEQLHSLLGPSLIDTERVQRAVQGIRTDYTSRRPPAPVHA